ncbi:MAG: PepSY-like domain-containing protein [Muribaculaceae bacterium]|nr:PepSY-like domain-containing protein [Muribaculaceae bacterium]
MKKLFMAMFLAVMAIAVARADKYTIDRSQLPAAAQEMLEKHFPKAKVSMIKVDRHLLKKTDYDVKLTNGTKIEFNNAGKWTSVDCKTREVPQSLVLKPIRNYVAKNYAGLKIVEIEKKASGYEIELSDGVELKFNLLGSFTKVLSVGDD